MRFDVHTGGEAMTAPKRPLINTREVCERLDICRSTLDRLVRQRRIRPVRLGLRCVRYDPAAVDALIEEAESGGPIDG